MDDLPKADMSSAGEPGKLERTSSQLSTASRKSATVRIRPQRKPSLVSAASSKTLESFPSLPADVSPKAAPRPDVDGGLSSASASHESPQKSPEKELSMLEKLMHSSPSMRSRSALFEDAQKASTGGIVGSIRRTNDEQVEGLLKKNGPVVLARRLAQGIFERDLEIATLKKTSQARERALRELLREAHISEADIETKLNGLDSARGSMDKPNDGVDSKGLRSLDAIAGKNDDPSGLGVMLGEAMGEDVSALEINEGYLDSLDDNDRNATLKAKKNEYKASGDHSLASSLDSNQKNYGTLKNWKDYLWSGTVSSKKTSKTSSIMSNAGDERAVPVHGRSQSSSGRNGRRTVLDNGFFQPPESSEEPPLPTDGSKHSESRKSSGSGSVSSWTMKLFAGNPGSTNATKNSKGDTGTRSSSRSRESRSASFASATTPRTARAALLRVNSKDANARSLKRMPSQSSIHKAGRKASNVPPVPPLPATPVRPESAANLGPVEMDTIHPPDSKPPTLLQAHEKPVSEDLLTDRFGFIYDQRRRKREAEASTLQNKHPLGTSPQVELISSGRASTKSPEPDHLSQRSLRSPPDRPDTPLSGTDEAGTGKRWQDYLKVATFPTELLSHTPATKTAGPVILRGDEDSDTRVTRVPSLSESRGSMPSITSTAATEISPVNAGKAEISGTLSSLPTGEVTSSTIAEPEPVKLLLAQLTDVHDKLQHEKTVRWNEFLRKVRAERRREGEAAAASTDSRSQSKNMPEVMIADGEIIGTAGLGNKGKVGRAKWKEFKYLVLGGIPVAYRAKIWAECSGASALRVPGYYDDLLQQTGNDAVVVSQIHMDINRTLTDNVFFRNGPGVTKLEEVLVAYARRNPDVGYCQGMNLIAGSLLLVMPTAEDAFWVLTSMIENILPQHYYDQSLLASRADQQVLRAYVAEILPKLSAHLDELGIELEALTFQWFLSVFTDCLSAEALFRVWDVIFCFNDGSTFLFQVALALLKLNEAQLLECDNPARIYEYIGNEMTEHAISIDGLVQASEALKNVVLRREVEERRWRALEAAKSNERPNANSEYKSGHGSVSADSGLEELHVEEPRPYEPDLDIIGSRVAGLAEA